MKKVNQILSYGFAALFCISFTIPAWCFWILNYIADHIELVDRSVFGIGGSQQQWFSQLQRCSSISMQYLAPVFFLLLLLALVLSKTSWSRCICHLFFTLSLGFLLILFTQYIPTLSLPNRTDYVPLSNTLHYILNGDPAYGSSDVGFSIVLLSGPIVMGLYAFGSRIKSYIERSKTK